MVPGLASPPAALIVAYLLGAVTADAVGYVHVVATRNTHRGRGLATHLWSTFEAKAREAGAKEIQAVTTPGNAGSIAFHTGIGMTALRVPDYKGPGEDRVLFRKHL